MLFLSVVTQVISVKIAHFYVTIANTFPTKLWGRANINAITHFIFKHRITYNRNNWSYLNPLSDDLITFSIRSLIRTSEVKRSQNSDIAENWYNTRKIQHKEDYWYFHNLTTLFYRGKMKKHFSCIRPVWIALHTINYKVKVVM